jgi:hypothetical protein
LRRQQGEDGQEYDATPSHEGRRCNKIAADHWTVIDVTGDILGETGCPAAKSKNSEKQIGDNDHHAQEKDDGVEIDRLTASSSGMTSTATIRLAPASAAPARSS